MLTTLRTFILVALLLSHLESGAQLYVRSELFSVRDGLSDNRISCLLQDKSGFFWIGTRNGLNRYDGHEFRVFRPTHTNSISNEIINDLASDDSGYLWVATMEGLNKYDPRTDLWVNYGVAENSQLAIPNWMVRDIHVDSNQRLWIVTDVRELSSLDLRTGKITRYDWPSFARTHPVLGTTAYRSIQKLIPGKPGYFFLGTNRGLVEFNIKTGEFKYLGGHYNENLRDMHYDALRGRVLIVTEEGELFEYIEKTGHFKAAFVHDLPYPSSNWLEPDPEDQWLASPKGLLQASAANNGIWLHPFVAHIEGYLQPGGVSATYREAPGVIWVGSPNGLNRMDWRSSMARFIPLAPASFRDGENKFASVFADSASGNYFVCGGGLKKVFVVHDKKNISTYERDLTGRPFSNCNAICPDNSGNIWLLTEESLYRWNTNRLGFEAMPPPPEGFIYNFRDMVALPDGSMMLAAFSSGLWTFQPGTKQWKLLSDGGFRYTGKPTSLAIDRATGMLWVGTFGNGLFGLHSAKGDIRHYDPEQDGASVAPLHLINDLDITNDGKLLVATNAGGIFTLRAGVDGKVSWQHFSMREGLLSNQFLSVVAGDNGQIWALSGHRVHQLDSFGKNVEPLVLNRIMPIASNSSDERMPHAAFFDHKNRQFLYASGGGLNLVPANSERIAGKFPVVFTQIHVAGKWKTILDASANDQLEVPYRYNSISFQFAALYFERSRDIQYQHRLEGYNEEWQDGTHTASFNNLPPGKYRFVVRALVPGNSSTPPTASFSFSIVPPFWRTWWFISGLAALLALGLFLWIQSLRRNVRSQKILTYFATSLYGQNSVDDVFWDIARNCISQLKFEDCVIYLFNEERQTLLQRAAYGPKSPGLHELVNPLEIKLGVGIVGHVAKTLKAEIVKDTSKDRRYIVDDNARLSEMAVPIIVDGKLFGVIDSEHTRKNFYTRRHLQLMTRIAEICAAKISKYQIEERIRLKIARDLHDEMGSTLTSINIISKMAMEEAAGQPELQEQLQKIKDHSARVMDSMSEIVWAINPANDSFEKTILRMKEFATEILEPAGINVFFNEEEGLSRMQLDIEKRKEIYMIFKEVITNAAKYSDATEVHVQFRDDAGRLLMRVVDNGKGFDLHAAASGNGLKNMRTRAAQLQAEFTLESIEGTGTAIQLIAPIT